MAVHDFDVRRAGCVLGPLEANAPLHVDAYGVLPCPVAFQGFQAVAGQAPQVLKTRRGIQNFETLVGLSVETLKLPDKFAACLRFLDLCTLSTFFMRRGFTRPGGRPTGAAALLHFAEIS
jgi:hypothetical protein